MFLFTKIAKQTKSHIKISTAFIYMAIRTMLSTLTFLFYKIGANFQIMTKITSLAIRAYTIILEFFTSFNFRLIMGMGTAFPLLAFTVDKFFTYSICCKLWMISICCSLWDLIITSLSIHLMIALTHVPLVVFMMVLH